VKRLRNLAIALAMSAGAATALPVATHSAAASSPYGCWNPAGWGVRLCYQITGWGHLVYTFQGQITNYWPSPIRMLTQVRGPAGGYYYANLYVPASGTTRWVQNEFAYLPTGPYCVYYGANGSFHACYSVI
jgi:hypothetical protein